MIESIKKDENFDLKMFKDISSCKNLWTIVYS